MTSLFLIVEMCLVRVSWWWTLCRVWLTSKCAEWGLLNIPKKLQELENHSEKREAIWSILHEEDAHLIDRDPNKAYVVLTQLRLQSSIEDRHKFFEEFDIKPPLRIDRVIPVITGLIIMLGVSILVIPLSTGKSFKEGPKTTEENCTSEDNLIDGMHTTIILPDAGNNTSLEAPGIGIQNAVEPPTTVENSTSDDHLIDGMHTTIILPRAGNNTSLEAPGIRIQNAVEPPTTVENSTSPIIRAENNTCRHCEPAGEAVTSKIPRKLTGVCSKPGISMLKSLNFPIPAGAYECNITRTDQLNPDNTTIVYRHYCDQRSCEYSIATISGRFLDTFVLADNSLLVLKVSPRRNCEALQIGTHIKPTEASGLLMLQIELKHPEECHDLYLYVSRIEMPRLRYLGLSNIIVSQTSWEPLRKILKKPTVKNFSFNNSTWDSCSFDGIDPGQYHTAHFVLRNGHDMNVTRVVKDFIRKATNLTELRWNSPLPVEELWNTLQEMPKLKVVELTVELEQVEGKAQLNLGFTEHSNLENLHINLVVKNQRIRNDAGVEISLRQFERTGQKLSRIYIHATHPANILKPVESGECRTFEMDDNDTTVECTKQVRSLRG